MTRGAFEAEHALCEFVPEHVPRPVSHGAYSTRFDLYHYLCEFVEMAEEVPNPVAWAGAAAALHKRSMAKPAKQFGFHCTNYSAHVPIAHKWKPSWEAAWASQMKSLMNQDNCLHGMNEEYSNLQASFFDVVIPKYLGPLESGGRSITPCLIHSGLRPGNVKPRVGSESVCMLNSSAYWGHHEAELGICRIPHYGLGELYVEEYLKRMPISEPKEDFDVRNAIYAMKHHVLLSLIHHDDPSFRQNAIDEMKQLVKRAASS
ncbi:Fructosamine/Ketosamine-3-kinase [Nemania serpens]|nr:Fructosamine/Ketosamine-3-kinase [Nemania serpens]